jgi:hypothetical protein
MKMAYFIFYKKVIDVKDLIYIFIRFINVNYKLLRNIISN